MAASVTDQCDDAIRALFRTLAGYEDNRRFHSSAGTFRKGDRATYMPEAATWLIGDAIARLCALVEDFVELRFKRGETFFLAGGGSAAQWRRYSDEVDGSWLRRRNAWSAAFGVNLYDSADHAPLMGYVQARNAYFARNGSVDRFSIDAGPDGFR